ncbi:hypothetical protein C8P67_101412 [Flavobacterium aquicola]|uniref:Uncharacterized protein n=1 Tax=Flavobacterium aquicola TaxID=1682742 RepID=A0A3E0EUT3_9FLAO|nr:hypothetical protein C8P67_101412 [Flavobacterium aquicola]
MINTGKEILKSKLQIPNSSTIGIWDFFIKNNAVFLLLNSKTNSLNQ